jgi:ribosome-binding factor A
VSERRYPRTARLNEVILEVLADELERLSDPRLELVTLTGVEVNRDLSKASVYYSTLGDSTGAEAEAKRESTATALRSAAPHLRRVLSREVRVKQIPRLDFVEDPAITASARIEAILRDIHAGDRDESES